MKHLKSISLNEAKLEKTIAKIELPLVIYCGDYHDFADVVDTISTLSGTKVKSKEVTNIVHGDEESDGYYYAVIYTGLMPTKDVIVSLPKFNLLK